IAICTISAIRKNSCNRLKPGNDLEIHQPRCQPVWNGVSIIGKIFYQLIRDGILTIYQIEYFKACPNILKIFERGMTSSCTFFAEQLCAESDIDTDIRFDDEAISIFYAI